MPDAQPRAPSAPIIEHLIVLDAASTAPSVPARAHWTTYGSIHVHGDLAQEVPRLFVYGRRYEPTDDDAAPEVVGPALSEAEYDALYDQPWTYPTRDALLDRIYEVFQPCRIEYRNANGSVIRETRGRDV